MMREPERLTRPVDKLPIFDNAIRTIELLKVTEESFILRDTQHSFGENKVAALNVYLDRDQLAKTRDRIDQMLADKVSSRVRRSA